jgi:hypothetical protein
MAAIAGEAECNGIVGIVNAPAATAPPFEGLGVGNWERGVGDGGRGGGGMGEWG